MFQIVKEKRAIAAAAVGVVPIGSAVTWIYLRENTPIYLTGWDVADPVKAGDPKAAMEHSRKLLAILRRNNWKMQGIPFTMFQLPDRKFAEDPAWRGDRVSSYATEGVNGPLPGFEEVSTCSKID